MGPRRSECATTMRAIGFESLDTVLPRCRRERGELAADAVDRRAVHATANFRQPAYDRLFADARARRQSETGPTADAENGAGSDLPQTASEFRLQTAQGLPVFAPRCGHHSAEPSMVDRYHVHSHGAGIHVPGGDFGLVQPLRLGSVGFQSRCNSPTVNGSSMAPASNFSWNRISTARPSS